MGSLNRRIARLDATMTPDVIDHMIVYAWVRNPCDETEGPMLRRFVDPATGQIDVDRWAAVFDPPEREVLRQAARDILERDIAREGISPDSERKQ